MSEPKPFASLSSGLLARKGAARPAMRPQGFTPSNSGLEDLGWNDMGSDPSESETVESEQVVEHPRAHHRAGLTPVQSPVHSQQAELAERLNDSDEEFDEDYDDTAEPYEPEAGSGSFTGFASPSDDEEEDSEEAPEPEFKVQFKTGKRPLDLGPAPDEVSEPESEEVESFEDALQLEQADVVAPELQSLEEFVVEPAESAPVPAPALVLSTPARIAPSTGKAKAAFTLRLDPERHLKLRLACAVRGRSAQQLVTDALDELLGRMPELDDMADKAQKRGK